MRRLFVLLFAMVSLLGSHASAFAFDDQIEYEGPTRWTEFDRFMQERQEEDRVRGLSYIVSGSLATIGGLIGAETAQDSFGRGIFALTQSVGIAAIGFGAAVYWNGNEYDSFYRALRDSHLTPAQKSEVVTRFIVNEREKRNRARWILTSTYVLLSAINFYSASREPDPNVRNVLQFLGGANAVIALTFTFGGL